MNRCSAQGAHAVLLIAFVAVAIGLLVGCGASSTTSQGLGSADTPVATNTDVPVATNTPVPVPTNTRVPPPRPTPTYTPPPPTATPTITPTPLPTATPTPPPLASASVSNIQMQKQFDGCHLDADITNTSGNVAYTPTVKTLIATANGLESTTVTYQYNANFPAGDTWTFDYRIELLPLTTTPDYVTVTVLQAGQTIGQGQTNPFAIACP